MTSARTSRGDAWVALLRGINVGGRKRLPMKDLVAIFEAAGCSDVRSYIQSGNVVFRASDGCAAGLPKVVGEAVSHRFGFEPPLVMRSAHELHAVVDRNPFLRAGAAVGSLHVVFLADRPSAARAAHLDADRSPPDAFELEGREIYLQLPDGVARTKLTNDYFDTTLGTISTLRNWRTVLKLAEMVGAL